MPKAIHMYCCTATAVMTFATLPLGLYTCILLLYPTNAHTIYVGMPHNKYFTNMEA